MGGGGGGMGVGVGGWSIPHYCWNLELLDRNKGVHVFNLDCMGLIAGMQTAETQGCLPHWSASSAQMYETR